MRTMEIGYIYQWLDLIWIPVAFFVLHKEQRLKGIVFILSCVFTLRLQIELLLGIDRPFGILNILDNALLDRGFICYGIFIGLFLLLSYFSKNENPYVYIAAAITVFMIAFVIATVALIL